MGLIDKMKQAKDMYGNMKKMQQEIEKIECKGSSHNGLINVIVKGNHNVLSIKIDDSLQNYRDLEKDLLIALNDAHSKVDKEIKARMGGMMNLGDLKLPF